MSVPVIAPNYISVAEAATRTGLSRSQIRNACQRYRLRLEGRTSDAEAINPEAAATESREPRPNEIACTWVGAANARIYLIDANLLAQFHVRQGGAGRKPGTRLVLLNDGRTRRAIQPGETEPRNKQTWAQERRARYRSRKTSQARQRRKQQ
jgi:hypothetical protein